MKTRSARNTDKRFVGFVVLLKWQSCGSIALPLFELR
jgi:hypothetical protein